MQRLRKKYSEIIQKQLTEEFGIKNAMAIPKLVKVVVNSGIGDTLKDKALLESAVEEITSITGQKPSVQKAKLSVASFAIRRGMNVGLKVTLRGERMYAFLDKLFSIVLPRLRDFRGVSLSSFDRFGNYTLGLTEHSVFPEIDITKSRPRGLEITIVTSAKNPEESRKLLEYLGMPFEKN